MLRFPQISIGNRLKRNGGGTPTPVLSGVAVTYAGAIDPTTSGDGSSTFNITGDSTNSGGTVYWIFVTKGAAATAAATIKASADGSQALVGTSFDGTATRATLATMMGVQDMDLVIEDAGGFSNVVRLTIYNVDAKAVFDVREAITTMTDADKTAMNWWIVGRKGAWTTNQTVFWTNDVQLSITLNGTLAQEMVSWRFPGTKDMTAVGPPTISSAGWANTGTEYVRTNTINSVDLTSSAAFTFESDVLNNLSNTSMEMGASQGTTKRAFLQLRNSDNLIAQFFNNSSGMATIANTNSSEHHLSVLLQEQASTVLLPVPEAER